MIRRLQNFDFRSSTYDRPTQGWVCGKAALGAPCRRGPDLRGHCQTLTECEPRREGEDWVCGRSAAAGGACEDGPDLDGRCCRQTPACVPQRSLRRRRGRLVAVVAALSVAGLLLTFGGTWSRDIIHPGAVNNGHSRVEACADCHVAFEGGPAAWIHAAFSRSDPVADSRKCLTCHDKGAHALTPHNLARADMAVISKAAQDDAAPVEAPWTHNVSQALFPLPEEADQGPLACATCHKEHEGEDFDLSRVSDARCQTCHSNPFHAFSEGHPDFAEYPYLRRTRVVFDHDGHNRKHFPEEKKKGNRVPETCAQCHVPDMSGRYMIVRSFADTCATCHTDDITGDSLTGPKGIAVFAIPGLDLETLAERGMDIGQWPEFALNEEIPPFTKLLLSSEREVAAALRAVENLDLQDLTEASLPQLDAVVRIAWAVKELMFDLTVLGAEGFESRVEASLDLSVERDALGRLFGQIPHDVVRSAARSWFPKLNREITDYRERKAAFLWDGEQRADSNARFRGEQLLWRFAVAVLRGQAGSDSLSDDELLAIDDDAIHPDDELLRIDEAGNAVDVPADKLLEGGSSGSQQAAPAPEPEPAEPEQETETAEEASEPASEEPAKEDVAQASDEPGSVPIPVPRPEGLGTAVVETVAEEPEADQPEAAEATDEATDEAAAEESEVAEAEPVEEEDIEVPTLDPEAWAKAGGWYRRDFVLFYRPAEHEDRFLKSWFDISAQASGTSSQRYGEAVFALLQHKDTPGKCIKCHSVDRQPAGKRAINWKPFAPMAGQSKFTMFAHDTHFGVLSDDEGCVSCHALNPEAKYLDSYKLNDPNTFAANFAPLKRDFCSTCHVKDAAGDACTMCHRYHIGEFTTKPMATRMAELTAKPEAGPKEKVTEEATEQVTETAAETVTDAATDAATTNTATNATTSTATNTTRGTATDGDGKRPSWLGWVDSVRERVGSSPPEPLIVAPIAIEKGAGEEGANGEDAREDDFALAGGRNAEPEAADPEAAAKETAASDGPARPEAERTEPAAQVAAKPASPEPAVEPESAAVVAAKPEIPPPPADPEVEPKTAAAETVAAVAAATEEGLAIHLSSHRSEDDAAADKARMETAFADVIEGTSLSVIRIDLGDRGIFYRVRSGPYPDRPMAEARCAVLKSKKQDCLIVAY